MNTVVDTQIENAPGTAGTLCFEREGKDFVMRAQQWLPADEETIWSFVADCRHMNDVIPPFMSFEILNVKGGHHPPPIAPGVKYEYKLHLHRIGFYWRTLITEVDRPRRFKDVQDQGPYAHFSHEHLFEPDGEGTMTTDIIRYRPPGGLLASMLNAAMVQRDLRKLFACRHRRMAELFADGSDPGRKFLAPASSVTP